MQQYETQLWYRIFRRFSVILSIKTAIVTVLCYFAGYYISLYYSFFSPAIAGLWCIISGIVVLQVFIKESFSAAWVRILGSFVGAFLSFIFSYSMGYSVWALALCVIVTVMITSFFHIKETFRLACLTAAIVIVIGMTHPQLSPLMNAASRFFESMVGALIAIAITAIFFPLRKKLQLLQH